MARNITALAALESITADNVLTLSEKRFEEITGAAAVKAAAAEITGSLRKVDAAALAGIVDTLAQRSAAHGSHAALVRLGKVYAARAAVAQRSASDVIRAAWRLNMIGTGKAYTPRTLAALLGVTPSLVSQCKPAARKGAAVKGAGRKPNREKVAGAAASVAQRDTLAGLLAAAAGLEALTEESATDTLAAALATEEGKRAAAAIVAHAATLAHAVKASKRATA